MRYILFLKVFYLSFYLSFLACASYPAPPWPNPKEYRSGDLLWPSKPGTVVPYSSKALEQSPDSERKVWNSERKRRINQLRAISTLEANREAQILDNLSYDKFYMRYMEGRYPGQIQTYSSGILGIVGHVALVEVAQDNTIWIIEAALPDGVTRIRYAEWLEDLTDYYIWHGRLRNVSANIGEKVIAIARKQVGKPYDFWNLNLLDDTGFYCSKLVWFSTFHASGLAVDRNSLAERNFWFSPKQLLESEEIERLYTPGNYGR